MTAELITPETFSTQVLHELLDAAFIEHTVDDDGDISIRERFTYWLLVDREVPRRAMRAMAVFRFKESSTEAECNALANHINDDVRVIRAAASGDQLVLDRYIHVDGGVTPRNIVHGIRDFQGLVESAIARDRNGLLK